MGLQLNFTIYPQENTNWCWAACSYSIAKYYNAATDWTQCKIVNAEFGRSDCCTSGSSTACNQPWLLDRALARVGYFKATYIGQPTLASLEAETATNALTGARIGWYGGGGHVVVLSGADTASGYVVVKDPWGGVTRTMTYDTFRNAYQNNGQLTQIYETR